MAYKMTTEYKRNYIKGRGFYENGKRQCLKCKTFFETISIYGIRCSECNCLLRTKPHSSAGRRRLIKMRPPARYWKEGGEWIMQKLETTKTKFQSCGNVFCICGHHIFKHRIDGCNEYVEGTECEDRWKCPCECRKCIRINKKVIRLLQNELRIDNY